MLGGNMKVTIQMPEIIVIISAFYVGNQMITIGWLLFSLGLFLAICRVALEQKEKEEKAAFKNKLIDEISAMLMTGLTRAGTNFNHDDSNLH